MTRSHLYDVAQVCMNGHSITSAFESYPQFRAEHCPSCGSPTITQCPSCEEPIRGEYRESVSFVPYDPPRFCRECGKPYPWTMTTLEAAAELVEEMDGLSDDERKALSSSLDDLVRDTPRTPAAAAKFKRLIGKAGSTVAAEFRALLVDVISETAKKLLYPGS